MDSHCLNVIITSHLYLANQIELKSQRKIKRSKKIIVKEKIRKPDHGFSKAPSKVGTSEAGRT